MSRDRSHLDFLFEGCEQESWASAARWLHEGLRLQGEIYESFPAVNSDPARALEFLRFYAEQPGLTGWRRYFLADLVVASLLEAFDGDSEDAVGPDFSFERDLPELEFLIRSVRGDRWLMHFLRLPLHEQVCRFHPRYEQFLERVLAE